MDYKDFLYLLDIEIELENRFDNIESKIKHEVEFNEEKYETDFEKDLIIAKLKELKLFFTEAKTELESNKNKIIRYYLNLKMTIEYYSKNTKSLIQTNPQLSIERNIEVDNKYIDIENKVIHHYYIENIISTIKKALRDSVIYKYNFQNYNFDKHFKIDT